MSIKVEAMVIGREGAWCWKTTKTDGNRKPVDSVCGDFNNKIDAIKNCEREYLGLHVEWKNE
jgi:hypothetical protein